MSSPRMRFRKLNPSHIPSQAIFILVALHHQVHVSPHPLAPVAGGSPTGGGLNVIRPVRPQARIDEA